MTELVYVPPSEFERVRRLPLAGADRAALFADALPDQRALHDRAGGLGPHRHQLQQPGHRVVAVPGGAARGQ